MLDEPLDSLDLRNQQGIAGVIRQISRETGAAVLLVAHDVNPILTSIDRVVYMAHGQVAVGTPQRSSPRRRSHASTLPRSRCYVPAMGESSSWDNQKRRSATMPNVLINATTACVGFDHQPPMLFHYHFMQNAYIAGTLVALISGIMGYFVVLRHQSFAGHSLGQCRFCGGDRSNTLWDLASCWPLSCRHTRRTRHADTQLCCAGTSPQ